MREIKFRAWKWIPSRVDEKEEGIMLDDVVYSNEIWNKEEISINKLLSKTHYKIMQYTGLKDKNNVEIYEGDIVKDRANRFFEVGYCFDYKEKGDRSHFARYEMRCIKQSDKDNYKFTKIGNLIEFTHWVYPKSELEVIGNIYENPELLKG